MDTLVVVPVGHLVGLPRQVLEGGVELFQVACQEIVPAGGGDIQLPLAQVP